MLSKNVKTSTRIQRLMTSIELLHTDTCVIYQYTCLSSCFGSTRLPGILLSIYTYYYEEEKCLAMNMISVLDVKNA